MQSSPQATRIPPAISQTASTYQLGNVVAKYGLIAGATVRSAIGGIVILLGGAWFIIGVRGGGPVFGGVLILISLRFFWEAYKAWHSAQSKLRVYVCERGLIYTQKNTPPQPMGWESLLVWRSAVKLYQNAGPTGTTYRYTLQRDDGFHCTLDDDIKGIADLGNLISDSVTKARFPGYVQAYNAGQTLSFGTLTISTQGVGNGRELLPWSDVNDIDVQSGYIKVKRAGGWFSWKTVAASSIPNLFIFLALSDYVLRQHGKKR